MATSTKTTANVDNFFASSAARFDRWRELNAKAQTWAAGARGGNARAGRAAVEAAFGDVRPLEDYFAYPGGRLLKTLAERIAVDDAIGVARLVRRVSASLLSGSYRHDSGQWESSDDDGEVEPERLSQTFEGGQTHRPYFEALFVSPAPAGQPGQAGARNPSPAPHRRRDDLRAGFRRQRRGCHPRHDPQRQDPVGRDLRRYTGAIEE
jgi:arginine decarboxylase